MAKTIKKDTLHAVGFQIGIYTTDFENEFISLTDIAKYRSIQPSITIHNWLRGRDTVEFLGLWESLHNPDFKLIEFDKFKINAGTNAMKSYNAILITQGLNQPERMQKLRELAIQQLKTLNDLETHSLPKLPEQQSNEE